jgi:hypothetical protein
LAPEPGRSTERPVHLVFPARSTAQRRKLDSTAIDVLGRQLDVVKIEIDKVFDSLFCPLSIAEQLATIPL